MAVKEAWRPALDRLVATTGECAHLAVLVGAHVWYIDKVDSAAAAESRSSDRLAGAAHCTALGKSFLAFGQADPPTELGGLHAAHPDDQTRAGGGPDPHSRPGLAVDDEEFTTGIRCVARPVYDESGFMIAAVGVSGPSVRVDRARLMELGRIVLSLSADEPAKEEIP